MGVPVRHVLNREPQMFAQPLQSHTMLSEPAVDQAKHKLSE